MGSFAINTAAGAAYPLARAMLGLVRPFVLRPALVVVRDQELAEGSPPEVSPMVPAPPPSHRRARVRRLVSAQTVDLARVSQRRRRHLALLTPSESYWRPTTRGDCATVPRPCPYVGCKYHLFLDVKGETSVKFNFPDLEADRVFAGPLQEDGAFGSDGRPRVEPGPFLDEMSATCALDVAEEGWATHEKLGPYFNLTRERIRQVEAALFADLRDDSLIREMAEGFALLQRDAPQVEPCQGG